jgi:peptidoglycan/xylan/chitin deacetylase (PgdA/CDA1 family)
MPEENGGSGSGSEDVYVILTFDDGPDTRVGTDNGTAMVLDKLDARTGSEPKYVRPPL